MACICALMRAPGEAAGGAERASGSGLVHVRSGPVRLALRDQIRAGLHAKARAAPWDSRGHRGCTEVQGVRDSARSPLPHPAAPGAGTRSRLQTTAHSLDDGRCSGLCRAPSRRRFLFRD